MSHRLGGHDRVPDHGDLYGTPDRGPGVCAILGLLVAGLCLLALSCVASGCAFSDRVHYDEARAHQAAVGADHLRRILADPGLSQEELADWRRTHRNHAKALDAWAETLEDTE